MQSNRGGTLQKIWIGIWAGLVLGWSDGWRFLYPHFELDSMVPVSVDSFVPRLGLFLPVFGDAFREWEVRKIDRSGGGGVDRGGLLVLIYHWAEDGSRSILERGL